MEKISLYDFVIFEVKYHRESMYQNLRFGQAFLNHFYPSVVDPDLFYKKEYGEAYKIIAEKYVEL